MNETYQNDTNLSEIKEYLISQRWKPSYGGFLGDEFEGYVDPSGDRLIDLVGFEYAWELKQFTDGDIDGVATGRFESSGVAGDTLAELKEALK